jgi:endonuclease-3 related protein
VIDTYTYRIVTRHGWQPFEADYAGLKRFFEERLPPDLDLYNDYHAQLVAVGHHHCRKTPKCEGCPLQPLLPNGQPLQPPSKP